MSEQAGLGLPDRRLLRENRAEISADARGAGYLVYVAKIFILAGASEAGRQGGSADRDGRSKTALAKGRRSIMWLCAIRTRSITWGNLDALERR